MTVITLDQAKTELRQNWHDGCVCRCCGQRVQLYNRKLSSSSAVSLIKLVRLYLSDHDWHHVKELGATGSGGEFARLERWGMLIPKRNEDSKKRCSGLWKPSLKGLAFAHGNISVPSHVLMFNGETYGLEGDEINIKHALGNKFDYAELMGYLV